MAFRAMTGLVTEWFEPERYKVDEKTGELVEVVKESEGCTKVQIKPLSGSDFLSAVTAPGAASQIITACRRGVVGWENLPDENGNPVKFDESKIIEVLPGEIMTILSSRILDISKMSREQEKNS